MINVLSYLCSNKVVIDHNIIISHTVILNLITEIQEKAIACPD